MGFLKVMESMDEDMPPFTKRSALEGTPRRESPSQMMPQVLVPKMCDPVSTVEMSAATIAAFANDDARGVCMGDMEHAFLERLTRPCMN